VDSNVTVKPKSAPNGQSPDYINYYAASGVGWLWPIAGNLTQFPFLLVMIFFTYMLNFSRNFKISAVNSWPMRNNGGLRY